MTVSIWLIASITETVDVYQSDEDRRLTDIFLIVV